MDLAAIDKVRRELGHVVADTNAWAGIVEAVSVATGSRFAALMRASGATREVSIAASISERADVCDRFVNEGWNLRDIRTRAVPRLIRTGVAVDQDITTVEEMARHPYYQEMFAAEGLKWWAGIGFMSGDDVWCLGLHRGVQGDYFDEKEQAILATLSGDLRQAAELARAFGDARVGGMVDALDLVVKPALVIGTNGMVIRANAMAEALYDPEFRVTGGRIVAADALAARALADLADQCRSGHSRIEPGRLVVRRAGGHPIVIHVHPLAGAGNPFATGRALLLLDNLDDRPVRGRELLVAVFGFTAKEAALADLLGAGSSLEQASGELALTRESGRSLLKQVFAKAGVARQGELVALLSRLPRTDAS